MTRDIIPIHPLKAAPPEAGRPSEPSGPTRRALVQWLASSAALAVAGCSRPPDDPIYSYAQLPELADNGAPIYYATAFVRAGHAMGVLVSTRDGRPIKVEGHPAHPASLGGTDVFAQAAILELWDPDRSRTVWNRHAPSTWGAFAGAWQGAMRGAREDGAVCVLTPRIASPTLARQLAEFLRQHPGARWFVHEVDDDMAQAGAKLAFGQSLASRYAFDRADCVIALGGDPFSDPAAGVRHAADWAQARSAAEAAKKPAPRLVVLETMPGLAGARADERWALTPGEIEQVVAICAARRFEARDIEAPPALEAVASRLSALLREHGERSLLWAGSTLDAATHARVLTLAESLRSLGTTQDLIAPPTRHEVLPEPGSLQDLVALTQGAQAPRALLMLGVNPSYTAPASLGFDQALARIPFTVHHGLHRDETAHAAQWHLPLSHDFEQWSDARAFDGTVGLMQPAIAPLYDSRSHHELFAILGAEPGAQPKGGHEILRAQWKDASFRASLGLKAAQDFDTLWREALRKGFVEGTRLDAAVLGKPKTSALEAKPAPPGKLVAVFPRDASLDDGRFANNGWLQELPRPFSAVTWGNALHLGPRTAAALRVETGDVVRVRADTGAVEAPVFVDLRHAEGAATLPLGYGRRQAGTVGDSVGVDTAPLRSAHASKVYVSIEPTGRRVELARTQLTFTQEGRDLAREREEGVAMPVAKSHPTLYPQENRDERAPGKPAPAWGMAIDLDACIGCNVCTIACQAENNIPVVGAHEVSAGRHMHWIRIDHYVEDSGEAIAQPVACQHCENAPCEVVCPVGATVHDEEGLNVQVYNRCVGTRFCSNNCPYKVRRFNFRQYNDVKTEALRLMRNPDVTVRSRGVMEKCTYCVQRISHARREERKNGDLPTDTVKTACQSACPTGAIHFGDLNDAASAVNQAKASPRNYALLDELGTRPRTTYLARVAPRKPGEGA